MDELTQEEVTGRSDEEVSSEQLETQLAHWVTDRWEEAGDSANQEAERSLWDEWVTAYWGEVPAESLPSYRQPIITQEMRDLILHESQEISDTKPRIHVSGKQLKGPILNLAEELLQAQWDNCDVQGKLLESVIWSRILPCGWIGVYWEPMLEDGLGDIVVCAEDPRTILPAPQAKDDINWPYVIKEDWLDLWRIRQSWPGKGDRVKEDSPTPHAGTHSPRTRSSPYLGPMFASPESSSKSSHTIPQARVLTIWVRDPGTEVRLRETKDQFGNIQSVTPYNVMKYPRGRMIQVAGDVILYDQPWYARSFPLFRVIPIPATGGFYPSPLLRDMLPIQQGADKSWEQLIQNAERINHGVWFTTGETGIDPGNFAPMPGMVVQGDAGSTLEMKAPPPFPTSFMEMPERLAGIMRRKAGFPPARSGDVRGANIGQGLIETEISQAESPTRLAARLLYRTALRVAQHMLETMALHYRTTRTVTHMSNGVMKDVTWKAVDEDQAGRLISHIDPNSFYPRSETLEKNLILRAAGLGLVGPEYVLDHLQLPDLEKARAERNTDLFKMWSALQAKGGKKKKTM